MLIYQFNIAIIKYKWGELFNNLFANIILFVLLVLNFTFHCSAQDEIFCKSLLRITDVSAGSEPETNKEVSSAKIKISLWMSFRMSFI